MPTDNDRKDPSTTRPHKDNSLQKYLWPFLEGDTSQATSLHEPIPPHMLSVPITFKGISKTIPHSNICLPQSASNVTKRADDDKLAGAHKLKQHSFNAYKTESASHYASIRRKELHDQYWTRGKSSQLADDEGVSLNSDHWGVILYLRKHYLHDGLPRHARYLARDLVLQYKHRGGNKFLRLLFPGGPITQGSRLANLRVPADASDASYGCCY